MGAVTFRPATKSDIDAFSTLEQKPTAKAWVAEVDGSAIALGGFGLVAGRWIGFIDVTEDGRELLKKNVYVRAALVKGAMMGLRRAKELGVRFVYAKADMAFPRADELLNRLGFFPDPRMPQSENIYRWSATSSWQK